MAPDTSTAGLAAFFSSHAKLLARLHAKSAAARWKVSSEDLSRALYRSAVHRFGASLPGGDALAEYLEALHLEDLALACALRRGVTTAWEEFVAAYRPVLYASSRAIVGSAGEARARELADSLYAELYGLSRATSPGKGPQDAAGRRPLLDYFHGRSKLSTWLRAVLAQRHVDALRATQRIDPLDDESPVAVRVTARDTDLDPDRARLLPHLQFAVAAALAKTAPADRLLLSLYYLREMTLAQIAAVQGVHEATISRQLERIRRELRSSVEHSLLVGHAAENGTGGRPGLSPAQVELCFRYAVEDWAFDLGGALSDQAETEKL